MCRILLYRWAGRGGSRNGILPITSNLKERNNVQNRKLYEVRLKDIDGNEIVIVEFAALPNAAGSEFNRDKPAFVEKTMYSLLLLNLIIPFVMILVGWILKKHPVMDMKSHNGYNTPAS